MEQTLPSSLRRHFQLVRLLEAESNLRRKCSKEDLSLIAQRCEDMRRNFLNAVNLFQQSTKVRLIKMEFLQIWSKVAVNIYRNLLAAEKLDDPDVDKLVESVREVIVSSVPEEEAKPVVKKLPVDKGVKCLLCADAHNLTQCTKFEQMELWRKRHFVKSRALCFVCLQSGHSKVECRSEKVCAYCGNRHATIIHDVLKVIGMAVEASRRLACIICGPGHMLFQCDKFGEMNPAQRMSLVNTNQLCVNCLHGGHTIEQCHHPGSCRHCGDRHHSLLHLNFGPAVRRK